MRMLRSQQNEPRRADIVASTSPQMLIALERRRVEALQVMHGREIAGMLDPMATCTLRSESQVERSTQSTPARASFGQAVAETPFSLQEAMAPRSWEQPRTSCTPLQQLHAPSSAACSACPSPSSSPPWSPTWSLDTDSTTAEPLIDSRPHSADTIPVSAASLVLRALTAQSTTHHPEPPRSPPQLSLLTQGRHSETDPHPPLAHEALVGASTGSSEALGSVSWQAAAYGANAATVLPMPLVARIGDGACDGERALRPAPLVLQTRRARGAVCAAGRVAAAAMTPTAYRSPGREAALFAADLDGQAHRPPPDRLTIASSQHQREKWEPPCKAGKKPPTEQQEGWLALCSLEQ